MPCAWGWGSAGQSRIWSQIWPDWVSGWSRAATAQEKGQSWNGPGLRKDPESPGHREWGRKSIMDFRCGAPVTQTRDANTSTIRAEVRPRRSSGRSTSAEQVPCVTMGSHPPPEAFLSDSIKGWPTT